jgi:hypothetical protein
LGLSLLLSCKCSVYKCLTSTNDLQISFPLYGLSFHFFDILLVSFFFFCSTETWTQALHLEPLKTFFLWWALRDRVLWTICLDWLWTEFLLISASWEAKIIGVSHQHPLNSDLWSCKFWWIPIYPFSWAFGFTSKKSLSNQSIKIYCYILFCVLCFYLLHLVLWFLLFFYLVWDGSKSTLLYIDVQLFQYYLLKTAYFKLLAFLLKTDWP